MLTIYIKDLSGPFLIIVKGDMIFNDLKELEENFMKLIIKKPRAIGIDFSDVSSLDSSGLGLLIKFSKEASKIGSALTLVDVPDKIGKVFDLSKMDSFFEMMSLSEFSASYKD